MVQSFLHSSILQLHQSLICAISLPLFFFFFFYISCHCRYRSFVSHGRTTLFLINSLGTRGATSAEYFLKAGYAVIFMHRQFSLQPFSRHYSHSTNPFLDLLNIDDKASFSAESPPNISVLPSKRLKLFRILNAYKAVHHAGTLHTVTFVTVNEYLWLLRAVSQELSRIGRMAMYYLAAAVSDFFLPMQKMVSVSVRNLCTRLAHRGDQ